MRHEAQEETVETKRGGHSRSTRMRRWTWSLAAAGVLSLGLAGCYGTSTYYDHRTGQVFDATGTDLDCSVVEKSSAPGIYWRGLAGGRIFLGPHETRNIAREACFKSEMQCQYWLTHMSAALTHMTTGECTRR
ncbi:hypothetical protein [Breoghania sp.]|uniref:hypothetical protein n=1 Tax=Breoghania sp. TaxID=2065378 RepID=UPI002623E399|nr:hypothetical protein [Breoghania sp.]MDJ0931776.1 hypothetical protein [Breoghania sp.]